MKNSSSSKILQPVSIKKFAVTQWFLIKSELLMLRVNWQWSLFIVLVAPLSVLLFLYLLLGRADSSYMTYALSGNIIMSLVTGTMLTLGQELGFLKDVRGFDYYASLPLYKIQLITAYLIRATIITIPSIMILIAIGKIAFNVQIVIHISLFVIVFLSGMSLAGLGAFIGIYSRNSSHASTITQILQPIIIYCAPVFIPSQNMPKVMQVISWFIPTTYVASALRNSFNGIFDWFNIAILIAFCVISVYLVEFKIDWRQK